MINKESKISLTYTLGGETLQDRGIYVAADVYVKNLFTKNEVFKINKPMRTVQRATYKKAQMQVTLNENFIEGAITLPVKPKEMSFHKWLRTKDGKTFLACKKMNNEQRVNYHVKLYVNDMGGEEYSYEII